MTVWNSVANEVFLQAVEIPELAERKDFLDRMCGEDANLRREVEALLSANEAAEGFLESPAELLPATDADAEKPGCVIDRYRLIEPIGEGGFGIVYRAEQAAPVRRQVALKIIKPGMDTRQVVARFQAERQVLALLQHPHVAQVYDGGTTPSGRPYFVMELVEGVPITDYCDVHRLSIDDRLDLFRDVCQAVQHAHLKGVIHRDLKPSNVLVTERDGRPDVKVIDFGVAKAIDRRVTEGESLTSDVQMIGTPLYMSPEQTEPGGRDVDTRSDIYSLGVLLYELLTGVTPFAKERLRRSTWDEFRHILRDEDPSPPSTRLDTLSDEATVISDRRGTDRGRLVRRVRGDLDWIVMKALEKDRTRRYQSAADLAADIERAQRHEPVSASPPSTAYQLRKFLRRHRVPIATAAVVAAALVAGAGVSLWQAVQATKAREAETAARKQAEENLRQARAAVDRYFTVVSETDLLDVPGVQPLRRKLLTAARDYYQQFLTQRSDDPELQAELAAACFRLAQVDNALDANDDAVTALRQGLEWAWRCRLGGGDRRVLRERLAGVYQGGRALHRGTRAPSNPGQARQTLCETTDLWEELVHEDPADPRLRSDLAGAYLHLGDLLRGLRQMDAALPALQRSAQLWEELVREDDAAASYRANLARCQGILSDVYRRLKRPDEARAAFRASLNRQEELVAAHPEVRDYRLDLAQSLVKYSESLATDEARGVLQRARDLLNQLTRDFPDVPVYRESLSMLRYEQAQLFRKNGDDEDAITALRDAIDLLRWLTETYPALPRYGQRLASDARYVAHYLFELNRPDEADAMYRLALSHWERLSREFPEEADYARWLARDLALAPSPDLLNPARAVAVAQHAVQLTPDDANCWSTLGVAQLRSGLPKDAATSLEKAMALRGEATGLDAFALAVAYAQTGKHALARESYDRAADWLASHPSQRAELRMFQSEAAAALQIANPAEALEPIPPPPSLPEESDP